MQSHRGRFTDGFWIPAALIPAVVMAIVAIVALAPGQVLAESEEEPQEVVCAGLGSLTMGVNTMTLQRNEEMTKHTYSSDGECKLSVTLIDVSSDDNPADKTKSCSVTVTPVRPDNSIDLTSTVSGDCGTVAFDAALAFGDSLPSGGS